MTRDHVIFRAYLNETGEIFESTVLHGVYDAVLRSMKAWAHINLGGNYTGRIYIVDERIECGSEDKDECLVTVFVDAGVSWTEATIVKGYYEDETK